MNVNCVECGKVIDHLEVFSKGECVECHEKTFVMPTARELIRMWGGQCNVDCVISSRFSVRGYAVCVDTICTVRQ